MEKKPELERIEKVQLREIWINEAENSTPWLAKHGLGELGEALGLELEQQSKEVPVGDFLLDMLCSESGTRECDANVIIWIAKDFRDEHRQALELLNQSA